MVVVRASRTAGVALLVLFALILWTARLAADTERHTLRLYSLHRGTAEPAQEPPRPEDSRPPDGSQTEEQTKPDGPEADGLTKEEPIEKPSEQHRVSRIHYLIPTTSIKPSVCASVASALANRYPIPVIVGYKGKGLYDAKAAHIAKLKASARYLHSLSDTAADDDLVMIVDGFDVAAQLPAEVTIKLYFDLMSAANQRVADQHGVTLEEARRLGLYQTLLWGADKGCFPNNVDEPQCWLIPDPPLPHNLWGPNSGNGEFQWTHSKHLNSGTVIGPLGDLRKFLDDTNRFINDEHDQLEHWADSDQLYIAKMYARQEYHRTLMTLAEGEKFPGLEGERILPPKRKDDDDDDQTEYHMTVDFDSAITQTHCHNDAFMPRLRYNNWDNSATMQLDAFQEGKLFKPYPIPMPAFHFQALTRVWESLPAGQRPDSDARSWVRSLPLGTNVATRRIFAFYHNTCDKVHFINRFQEFWYFPLIDALLQTATQLNRRGAPMNADPIDGRMWVDAYRHPLGAADPEGYGGVFTDFPEKPYLSFREACGGYWNEVFKKGLPSWGNETFEFEVDEDMDDETDAQQPTELPKNGTLAQPTGSPKNGTLVLATGTPTSSTTMLPRPTKVAHPKAQLTRPKAGPKGGNSAVKPAEDADGEANTSSSALSSHEVPKATVLAKPATELKEREPASRSE